MPVYYLGAIPDPYDKRDKDFGLAGAAAKAEDNDDLPPVIDNRGYCTAVRHQGAEASCVGHAIAGIAEFMYWKSLGKRPAFSPRWAYWQAQKHDHFPGEGYDGSTMRGGLKGWAAEGMAYDRDWPYVAGQETPKAADTEKRAGAFKLPRYERLSGIGEARYAIHQQGAVLMTVMVHDGWEDPGSGVIARKAGYEDAGWHAIVAVGYDEQAFIIRNSWGPGWGMGGYGRLELHEQISDVWLPLPVISWGRRLSGVMTWVGCVWDRLRR
jgi:hypothetical protein